MGEVHEATLLADLEAKHPIVGAVRSIGLFGIVELVKDRKTMRAAGAVQRHVGADGRARTVLPPGRALHVRALEHVLHEPAAVHHGGRARAGFDIIDRGLTEIARTYLDVRCRKSASTG